MPPKWLLAPVLIGGFPLASYALLKSGVLPAQWLGFPDGVLAVGLFMGLGTQGSPAARLLFALLAIAACLAGLAFKPGLTAGLLPVLVNLLLARLFQMTLRPGVEPLISRIARIARQEPGGLPAELAAYTRRLTLAWVVFFLILAMNALMLAAFGSLETMLLFANTLNFVFMGLFFVGENLYRRYRYRAYPHTPLWRLLATLARHGWRIETTSPAAAHGPGRPV
jgi:uncharacterized membrane protein